MILWEKNLAKLGLLRLFEDKLLSKEIPSNNQTARLSYNDVQTLIRETDQLRNQLQFLLQQTQLINDSIIDLEGSKSALKEMMSRPINETILIPLGTQILVPVTLNSKETVLHDLGSNILKNIPVEDSIKKIEERIEVFKKSFTSISSQVYQLENMIAQRENILNQLVPINDTNK